MKPYAAIIEHKHGTDLYLAATPELLDAELADYARQWWEDELPGEEMPETDAEIVADYFELCEREFLTRFGAVEITAEA